MNMRLRVYTLSAIAALCVSGAAYAQTRVVEPNLDDESLLRSWIQTISSDEFGGRKPMTGYEEKFHALGTPIHRCEIEMPKQPAAPAQEV